MSLDVEVCERARLSKDARFDGKFYTGVTSTGIFCRPVCPAPPPLPKNVVYYRTVAEALGAGLRPCLRCRPESAPGAAEEIAGARGDDGTGEQGAVNRALGMIESGALDEGTVATLAKRVGQSERNLRRLFKAKLGAGPVRVAQLHRALLAKKLLQESEINITQAAMYAGFGSLRQFNQVFRQVYGNSPSAVLGKTGPAGRNVASGGVIRLELFYRPGFDWRTMLDFFSARIIPGVEAVDPVAGVYQRTIRFKNEPGTDTRKSERDYRDYTEGWFEVRQAREKSALELKLYCDRPLALPELVRRIRRMFDLDADLDLIHGVLKKDPLLRKAVKKHPGLRLPGAWDPFEFAIRAILGQQISVKAATTLAARIAAKVGPRVHTDSFPPGLTHFFPDPDELSRADISKLGIMNARQNTIREFTRALRAGEVSFDPTRDLEEFEASMCKLPGIGPWSAHYMAMRTMGMPDAFPDSDLGILKAMEVNGKRPTPKIARQRAEAWRPWRAYAALLLWSIAGENDKTKIKHKPKRG